MKFYFILFLILLSCHQKDNKNTNNTFENIYYKKAWYFLDLKNQDSAFIYFNKAKSLYSSQKDNIGIAKCLLNMATIQSDFCDYYGSQENAIEAVKIFEKNKDSVYIAINYNLLGTNELKLKNYKKSIDYLTKAAYLTNNSHEKNIFLNNKAIAFAKMKNYDSAFSIFSNLLSHNIENLEQVKDNYFYFKWKEDSNYDPLPELRQSLLDRESEKDLWGQNASHAHLSDYFHEKNKVKALFHAQKMLSIATKLNSPDDRLEALQKLVLLETPENSKMFFLKYQKLNDSLQTARAKAKNQFALIRYETEKEKAENARKQNHILKQNIVIGTLIFGLFGGFFIYKRRKKRVQQENEIKVKNTQIKYSRKVHDVVANGLYHTMMQIQNNPDFSKEQTLNDIEKMYEESRDIARDDLNEIQDKDFAKRLSEMLNSYSSEHQKVFIVGNDAEKWVNSSDIVQKEIYYVLREAMVNMVKHSCAKLTSIKIESSEKQISVKYTDNGIGISSSEKKSTSGIRNMENRIAAIGGTIIFEKNPSGGLIIQITIPIQ